MGLGVQNVLNLIVLLLSLTVHEFFHAWTAYRLGDDTAARMGRLTLNPIPHIDIVGTLVLPLFAPIGWAKPVPVNAANFKRGIRMSTGDILVSIAGPLSNLGLALLSGIVLGILARVAPDLVVAGGAGWTLLRLMVQANVGLAIFNLLPVPPLDGSHVLGNLLPSRWQDAWQQFVRIGPILLMALVLFGSDLLWRVIGPPAVFLIRLFLSLG